LSIPLYDDFDESFTLYRIKLTSDQADVFCQIKNGSLLSHSEDNVLDPNAEDGVEFMRSIYKLGQSSENIEKEKLTCEPVWVSPRSTPPSQNRGKCYILPCDRDQDKYDHHREKVQIEDDCNALHYFICVGVYEEG